MKMVQIKVRKLVIVKNSLILVTSMAKLSRGYFQWTTAQEVAEIRCKNAVASLIKALPQGFCVIIGLWNTRSVFTQFDIRKLMVKNPLNRVTSMAKLSWG